MSFSIAPTTSTLSGSAPGSILHGKRHTPREGGEGKPRQQTQLLPQGREGSAMRRTCIVSALNRALSQHSLSRTCILRTQNVCLHLRWLRAI